ncbi:MAG TPA: hypothetical protein V6C86_23220 [Oculatellaceae cyanobacterium]
MKNSKSRASKGSPKASRTTTRLAAIKTTNREIESKLTVVKSKLAPYEVPPLKLDLHSGEVFEISDAVLAGDTNQRSREDEAIVVHHEVAATGSLTNS